MFRHKLYYGIKPFVPWSVRQGIRAWFARRKRERVSGVWPILPGSERPPEGWPGWPDGKKFAFVLTHDVESPSGVEKCRKLMELEMKYGFRSSFNFIPEGGEYVLSQALRGDLVANGFEIGVHDLNHDGKLYSSRAEFSRKATRINHYLKAWGAVGFRSGFMLHNLDWIHDLNIQYDASIFDTDPFEPQPDGAGTIFPFWVPRSDHRTTGPQDHKSVVPSSCSPVVPSSCSPVVPSPGYIELPYTLPQDSTLFLVFRERHPDLWFQKLDWIAKHGGMALLNVHPDYVCFDGETPSPRTFPAELYARFLQYACDRYGDSVWRPLPKELAAFAAQVKPRLRPRPKRVCMVAYSDYATDARITRYAEALAERGDHVDVLAVRSKPDAPAHQTLRGVNVISIQTRVGKNEKSRLSFLFPVLRFLVTSSVWVARRHRRKRYDVLHIHNVPDFLVFAALYPKLTGAKVILDIHDILPEFYASKFDARATSAFVHLLKWTERASARLADQVIIANHLWIEKYSARTGANGKCSVFINNVDANIFQPRPRTRKDGKLVILFPGGLQWHQGLDIAIRAFAEVRAEFSNAEFTSTATAT